MCNNVNASLNVTFRAIIGKTYERGNHLTSLFASHRRQGSSRGGLSFGRDERVERSVELLGAHFRKDFEGGLRRRGRRSEADLGHAQRRRRSHARRVSRPSTKNTMHSSAVDETESLG